MHHAQNHSTFAFMTHLSFKTLGDPDKPGLMLLHGFMSSNAQWLLNTESLQQHYYLVLIELWGHGDSPVPEDISAYSIDRYLIEFESIRKRCGIDTWAVIGQSYGAGLVCHYAIAHPQTVTKVVVTNSRSAFGKVAEQRSNAARPPTDLRRLPYHPINARRFPEHVKTALVESADRMLAQTISDSGNLAAQLHFSARLADLTQPVMLTNGRYEKSFQPELAQLMAACPQLQVVNLDGGHSINIEDAAGFNRAVLEFLD